MPTRAITYREMQLQRSDRPLVKLRPKQVSPSLLGYDRAWYALSKAYRAAHPLCEHCEARGRLTPSAETDHIIPFDGLNDPLRLDWDNLQALCKRCHSKKTRKQEQRHG